MTTLQNIISILVLTTVFSCNNSSSNKTETTQKDSLISDSAPVPGEPGNKSPVVIPDEGKTATGTIIKFKELSIFIHRFIINDRDNKMGGIQADTVYIYPEPGETIEGKLISISNNQLTNLAVQQRFETSVTILNEGAHCDLREWKHFYSDWKQLPTNNKDQFTSPKYAANDYKRFPDISMDELKQKVKQQCGDEFFKLVEKLKAPTEYPSAVSISRYFLRLTGQRQDNGKTVTKLIVIVNPMGD